MPKIALETHSVRSEPIFLSPDGSLSYAKVDRLRSPVKILPVKLPVRPWPLHFTLKDRTLSPAAEQFIAHIRNFARSSPTHGRTVTADRTIRCRLWSIAA